MITYKITTENGEYQITQTGKDLYCTILDKFKIKYTIEEIKDNDNPHSEFRRMESEGVYEEKFSDENSSSDDYEHSKYYWDKDRNKAIPKQSDTQSTTGGVYFNDEWNATADIRPIYITDES